MARRLDLDKIREELNIFLDEHPEIAASSWASRMGVSRISFFKYLHGATKPQRKTLARIVDFMESYKNRRESCVQCGASNRLEKGLLG